MNKAVLVLNAGSSSIRFAVFVVVKGMSALNLMYRGQIEGIGHRTRFVVEGTQGSGTEVSPVDAGMMLHTHAEALQTILDWIGRHMSGLYFVAAGHRVVHGGGYYSAPAIVDEEVLSRLEELVPLAPLHQPHSLAAIKALGQIEPQLMQVACFDTAFHRTMPAVAQTFALPRALTAEGIRPYGFHGLSYEYIASVLPDYLPTAADGRVIVAHLGNGASLCAMVDRRSVATSMAFTPLAGLPMATRCGSLDPGVLLYLMREKGMDVDSIADLLNNKSGLLGVSGISGDMRELLTSGEPQAVEAVELFVYRAGRELGSMVAAAGGLDALVFSGGIGEHSAIVRQRICQQAAWLGIRIDPSANAAGGPQISEKDSPVSVWVIPTNEELVIARHAYRIARRH